ncbi:zona pellucida sperm-binding protein 3 isoform X2 [Amia ocellicauda]|uniref:zona pellucida sperm-binding protein 3 isoform X2 n=1 Tax=Amia ocellicauda TaxID=2972642 RepID=UPI0034643EA8
MAVFYRGVVLSLYVVLVLSQEDVTIQCGTDSLSVNVTLQRRFLPLDPSGLLLGNCPLSTVVDVAGGQAVFQMGLLECCSMRMATANVLTYSNVLTYKPTTSSFYPTPFSMPVVCVYSKPPGWAPPLYNPALGDADGFGYLDFSMEIMKDDFSGPRVSSTFFLGSLIPIKAAVAQQSHMPLVLFLEECVAATSANLSASNQTYPIISNYGCFVDSQTSNSRFQSRSHSSEIRLFVQAFRFLEGVDVYIHCQLAAWDPALLNDPTKKACNFNQSTSKWVDPDGAQSALCGCCSSSCNTRVRRDAAEQGLSHITVLGPVKILAEEPSGALETEAPAVVMHEGGKFPQWVTLVACALLVLAVLGALSMVYYFCVWQRASVTSKMGQELLIPVQIDDLHRAVGIIHCSFPKESY